MSFDLYQLFMDRAKLAEYSDIAKFEYVLTILNSLDVLIYVADFDTHELLFVNEYGQRTWGIPKVKRCFEYLQSNQTHPCSFCTNKLLLNEAGEPAGVHVWEFRNTVNNRWYQCRDQAIKWIDGRYVRLEVAVDITANKALEDQLTLARLNAEQLARIDPLTGIYNRRAFFESMHSSLETALRSQSSLCLVMVDVDYFKSINDILGHNKGDEALIHLCEVIQRTIRGSDQVYRFGGEEFVIVLPNCDDRQAVELVNRIKLNLAEHYIMGETASVQLTCSFGITLSTANATVNQLVTEADAAMYEAKAQGRNRVVLFSNMQTR